MVELDVWTKHEQNTERRTILLSKKKGLELSKTLNFLGAQNEEGSQGNISFSGLVLRSREPKR